MDKPEIPTLRMTKEDQEAFAEAILNPPVPNPILAAAMRRSHEATLDVEPRTVIDSDESFDQLCQDLGIDPMTLDQDEANAQ